MTIVQVNAVYQRCERDVLATCNCGVMVRSGDDVLVIDRCARRRQRMPPPLEGFSDAYAPIMSVMLYLNGRLTPGTRIHQLANGHRYIVSSSLSGLRESVRGTLKTLEWKTRHQTAGVENAGATSMESQNSRYLTLLQVGYNSQ